MRRKCQINVHLQSGHSFGKVPQFKSLIEVWEVSYFSYFFKEETGIRSQYKSFVYSPTPPNMAQARGKICS